MAEPPSRAAETAARQVESIVAAAERAALETRRQAEHEARKLLEEARKVGREELEEVRRKSLQLGEDARKEAAAAIAEAREAADAVMEDAQRLADALKKTADALTGEADRLVRDVQLAHRELLGSLRLPGVAERQTSGRARQEPKEKLVPPGPGPRRARPPGEVFDLPDWVGGEGQ